MRGWNMLLRSIRSLHFKKIQFIITLSFVLISVIVVLLVSFMLYNKFSSSAEENAYLNIEQIIQQVNANLELYVSGMDDVFEVIELKMANASDLTQPSLKEQLSMLLDTRDDLVSMALFTQQGDLVLNIPTMDMRNNTQLLEQVWYESALNHPGELQYSQPHIQNLFKSPYRWVVSMSKQISYISKGELTTGVLLVDFNFRTIDELSQSVTLGKKGYVYIIDVLGNIVYHPQQQLIYAGLKYENLEPVLNYTYGNYVDYSTGEQRIITIKTVAPTNWKIVGVAYADEIVTTKQDLSNFIFWFLLLVIVFVLIISIYVSAKISLPIRRLEKSVKLVEKGYFQTVAEVHGAYEVEQLSKRFNLMIKRIRELMEQIVLEQEAKRKSELDVLQAQINPHFLYNTLNSVTRLAEMGKSDEVVTTITSLSKLFRISLSKGKNEITLAEELEHVRHYLIIQQTRYRNKFRFAIESEPEVLNCMTLKLILQPIVENAIVHGIEYMVDEGYIHIYVGIQQDQVILRVSDNGLGMSKDRLSQVITGELQSSTGSGVGIQNVKERLSLYYGKPYGMLVESELEEGTTVTIVIPIQRREEDKEGLVQ